MPADRSPLGFAVIGLDHWYSALSVAQAISTYPHAHLCCVVDANANRAQSVAQQNHARYHSTDYLEALADPEVDVIACYTSIDKSPEIYIAAAEAGKHILSIKPIAMNLEAAGRVVQAVRKAGVKYLPGASLYLFSATLQKFKEWTESGRIGQLVAGACDFHAGLPREWPDSNQPGWFVDPKRVPGGAWLDHAIYFVQAFRTLFGAEVAEAEGTIGKLKYHHLEVEDYGQATLTFTNGAIATLTSTWLGAAGASRQSTELFGTQGTLMWDSLLNKIAVAGDFGADMKGWIQLGLPEEQVTRTHLILEELIESIHTGRETLYTVEDDYANLAACLAFYEAARSGQRVALST
jgi:predicted dehydrogenase